MFGPEINLVKSEGTIMGYPLEEQQRIADNLNYILSCFSITYLGVPASDTRIQIRDLDTLVEQIKAKAEPWSDRFTSKGSKTMLIKTPANLVSHVYDGDVHPP